MWGQDSEARKCQNLGCTSNAMVPPFCMVLRGTMLRHIFSFLKTWLCLVLISSIHREKQGFPGSLCSSRAENSRRQKEKEELHDEDSSLESSPVLITGFLWKPSMLHWNHAVHGWEPAVYSLLYLLYVWDKWSPIYKSAKCSWME